MADPQSQSNESNGDDGTATTSQQSQLSQSSNGVSVDDTKSVTINASGNDNNINDKDGDDDDGSSSPVYDYSQPSSPTSSVASSPNVSPAKKRKVETSNDSPSTSSPASSVITTPTRSPSSSPSSSRLKRARVPSPSSPASDGSVQSPPSLRTLRPSSSSSLREFATLPLPPSLNEGDDVKAHPLNDTNSNNNNGINLNGRYNGINVAVPLRINGTQSHNSQATVYSQRAPAPPPLPLPRPSSSSSSSSTSSSMTPSLLSSQSALASTTIPASQSISTQQAATISMRGSPQPLAPPARLPFPIPLPLPSQVATTSIVSTATATSINGNDESPNLMSQSSPISPESSIASTPPSPPQSVLSPAILSSTASIITIPIAPLPPALSSTSSSLTLLSSGATRGGIVSSSSSSLVPTIGDEKRTTPKSPIKPSSTPINRRLMVGADTSSMWHRVSMNGNDNNGVTSMDQTNDGNHVYTHPSPPNVYSQQPLSMDDPVIALSSSSSLSSTSASSLSTTGLGLAPGLQSSSAVTVNKAAAPSRPSLLASTRSSIASSTTSSLLSSIIDTPSFGEHATFWTSGYIYSLDANVHHRWPSDNGSLPTPFPRPLPRLTISVVHAIEPLLFRSSWNQLLHVNALPSTSTTSSITVNRIVGPDTVTILFGEHVTATEIPLILTRLFANVHQSLTALRQSERHALPNVTPPGKLIGECVDFFIFITQYIEHVMPTLVTHHRHQCINRMRHQLYELSQHLNELGFVTTRSVTKDEAFRHCIYLECMCHAYIIHCLTRLDLVPAAVASLAVTSKSKVAKATGSSSTTVVTDDLDTLLDFWSPFESHGVDHDLVAAARQRSSSSIRRSHSNSHGNGNGNRSGNQWDDDDDDYDTKLMSTSDESDPFAAMNIASSAASNDGSSFTVQQHVSFLIQSLLRVICHHRVLSILPQSARRRQDHSAPLTQPIWSLWCVIINHCQLSHAYAPQERSTFWTIFTNEVNSFMKPRVDLGTLKQWICGSQWATAEVIWDAIITVVLPCYRLLYRPTTATLTSAATTTPTTAASEVVIPSHWPVIEKLLELPPVKHGGQQQRRSSMVHGAIQFGHSDEESIHIQVLLWRLLDISHFWMSPCTDLITKIWDNKCASLPIVSLYNTHGAAQAPLPPPAARRGDSNSSHSTSSSNSSDRSLDHLNGSGGVMGSIPDFLLTFQGHIPHQSHKSDSSFVILLKLLNLHIRLMMVLPIAPSSMPPQTTSSSSTSSSSSLSSTTVALALPLPPVATPIVASASAMRHWASLMRICQPRPSLRVLESSVNNNSPTTNGVALSTLKDCLSARLVLAHSLPATERATFLRNFTSILHGFTTPDDISTNNPTIDAKEAMLLSLCSLAAIWQDQDVDLSIVMTPINEQMAKFLVAVTEMERKREAILQPVALADQRTASGNVGGAPRVSAALAAIHGVAAYVPPPPAPDHQQQMRTAAQLLIDIDRIHSVVMAVIHSLVHVATRRQHRRCNEVKALSPWILELLTLQRVCPPKLRLEAIALVHAFIPAHSFPTTSLVPSSTNASPLRPLGTASSSSPPSKSSPSTSLSSMSQPVRTPPSSTHQSPPTATQPSLSSSSSRLSSISSPAPSKASSAKTSPVAAVGGVAMTQSSSSSLFGDVADDDLESLFADDAPSISAPVTNSSTTKLNTTSDKKTNRVTSLDDELAAMDTDALVEERRLAAAHAAAIETARQQRVSYMQSLLPVLLTLRKSLTELLKHAAEVVANMQATQKHSNNESKDQRGRPSSSMPPPSAVSTSLVSSGTILGLATRSQVTPELFQPLVETLAEMAPVLVDIDARSSWSSWLTEMGPSSASIWFKSDRLSYRQVPLLFWTHVIGPKVYQPSTPFLSIDHDIPVMNMWLMTIIDHQYYIQHVLTQRIMKAVPFAAYFARAPTTTAADSTTAVTTNTALVRPTLASVMPSWKDPKRNSDQLMVSFEIANVLDDAATMFQSRLLVIERVLTSLSHSFANRSGKSNVPFSRYTCFLFVLR
jgi:hypothetical protein